MKKVAPSGAGPLANFGNKTTCAAQTDGWAEGSVAKDAGETRAADQISGDPPTANSSIRV